MSTITKEFTKEQLQQIIETDHVQCGEASSLARIALASLEAEPVAWLLSGGGAKNNVSFDSGNAYADPLREVTPLYTAPPAPVSVPDEVSWEDVPEEITEDDMALASAWAHGFNQCRAAMLQGAEPVSNRDELPDGWVACSDRLPETDGNYWGWWSESKRQGPVWFIKSELQAQFQSGEITHWMALPAAPQQEVK